MWAKVPGSLQYPLSSSSELRKTLKIYWKRALVLHLPHNKPWGMRLRVPAIQDEHITIKQECSKSVEKLYWETHISTKVTTIWSILHYKHSLVASVKYQIHLLVMVTAEELERNKSYYLLSTRRGCPKRWGDEMMGRISVWLNSKRQEPKHNRN